MGFHRLAPQTLHQGTPWGRHLYLEYVDVDTDASSFCNSPQLKASGGAGTLVHISDKPVSFPSTNTKSWEWESRGRMQSGVGKGPLVFAYVLIAWFL